MSLVVVELVESRKVNRSVEAADWERLYTAIGSEDEDEVVTEIEATLPALYKGLYFSSYKAEHKGGGVWDVSAKYVSQVPKVVGQSQFSFDTTGGKAQVKVELDGTAYTPTVLISEADIHDGTAVIDNIVGGTTNLTAGMNVYGTLIAAGTTIVSVDGVNDITVSQNSTSNATATSLTFTRVTTNFSGGINVKPGGGTPEGVEVPSPAFSFTITRSIADPLPQIYADALYALTGKVNTDTVVLNVYGIIYTFRPGELRFDGATGSKRGADAWEIVLKCEASPNADGTGLSLPPLTIHAGTQEITGIAKNGWDYLWISYKEATDDGSHVLVPVPAQVNISQVSKEAELGILFA